MKNYRYRVVLLYPDYAAKSMRENYGECSYADTVTAPSREQAITHCRAAMENVYTAHDPNGFESLDDVLVVDCYRLGDD